MTVKMISILKKFVDKTRHVQNYGQTIQVSNDGASLFCLYRVPLLSDIIVYLKCYKKKNSYVHKFVLILRDV